MNKKNLISGVLLLAALMIIAVTAFVESSSRSRGYAMATAYPHIPIDLPLVMILASLLTFMAGYYYCSGKTLSTSTQTTTTTDSNQNRSNDSGRFAAGTHVQSVKTQTTTNNDGN
jgi:hypothetical protein